MDDLERPAGLDFVIYSKPYGPAPWQTTARLRADAGQERDCTPQELKLYRALLAAQARVVELEAALDLLRSTHGEEEA